MRTESVNIHKLVIEKFVELFQGRPDVYAIQLQDGQYKPQDAEYSINVIGEHLAGRRTVGIYPVHNNRVRFTCIDLDEVNLEKMEKIRESIANLGLSSNEYLIEFSGKKGYHFWLFYSNWIEAKYARALGKLITYNAGLESLEVFPKQETVDQYSANDNGKRNLGSLIKLPMGIHMVSKKRSETLDQTLTPRSTRILEIKPLNIDGAIELLKANYKVYENSRVEKMTSTINSRTYPCFQKMQFGTDQGDRDEVAFRLSIHCYRNGIESDLALKLLQSWNERNAPPLSSKEIETKIRSAYSGKYTGFGCEKTFMAKYCSDSCKLKKNRKKSEDVNILIPPNGFVREYIDFAIECTDAPVQYHIMSAFIILSTIMKGDLWLEFGNTMLKPNIWAIIVGPSSGFRKTESLGIARTIIGMYDPKLIYPKEFTGERLMEIMSDRAQGAFFFSEFGSFISNLNKSYMVGVKEVLTELYDCKDDPSPQRSTKSGGDIYIRNPYINMYAASTLDWITGKITEEDIMSGFLPRWLLMPAVRKTLHYGLPPKADKLKRNALVQQLHHIATLGGEVDRSRIEDRFETWSKELDDRINGLSGKLQPFLTRYEIYALKIAMLYEISYNFRKPVSISPESLEYAISFMEFMFTQTREIIETKMAFSKFEKDRLKVVELIDNKNGSISRSMLIRYAHMLSSDLDKIVNNLVNDGTIEIENQQGGGPIIYKMRETE